MFGTQSNYRFGTSCAVVGDMSGNGLDDVLVGAPGALSQRGRCFVYAFDGVIDTTYCDVNPHSGGQTSLIGAEGSPAAADQNLTLVATRQPAAGTFGLFFFGPDAIQVPFGDGFRCIGGMTQRIQPPVSADATLTTRSTIDFSASYASAFVAGADLNFQVLVPRPDGDDGGLQPHERAQPRVPVTRARRSWDLGSGAGERGARSGRGTGVSRPVV